MVKKKIALVYIKLTQMQEYHKNTRGIKMHTKQHYKKGRFWNAAIDPKNIAIGYSRVYKLGLLPLQVYSRVYKTWLKVRLVAAFSKTQLQTGFKLGLPQAANLLLRFKNTAIDPVWVAFKTTIIGHTYSCVCTKRDYRPTFSCVF